MRSRTYGLPWKVISRASRNRLQWKQGGQVTLWSTTPIKSPFATQKTAHLAYLNTQQIASKIVSAVCCGLGRSLASDDSKSASENFSCILPLSQCLKELVSFGELTGERLKLVKAFPGGRLSRWINLSSNASLLHWSRTAFSSVFFYVQIVPLAKLDLHQST